MFRVCVCVCTCMHGHAHSVVSNCLWSHGLQHTRLLCPSPTPRAYSNSCPLSGWCHPTISSSVIPFSCPQSFPASGSFRLSQLALRIRCPKYWSFSFNISLSSEHPGLNSFRMDWLNLHRVAKSQIWLMQLSTHTHSQLKPLFLIRNSLLYICAGDIFTPKFRTLQ